MEENNTEEEPLTSADKDVKHPLVLRREDFVDDLSYNAVLAQVFGEVNRQKRDQVTHIKLLVCGATSFDV